MNLMGDGRENRVAEAPAATEAMEPLVRYTVWREEVLVGGARQAHLHAGGSQRSRYT